MSPFFLLSTLNKIIPTWDYELRHMVFLKEKVWRNVNVRGFSVNASNQMRNVNLFILIPADLIWPWDADTQHNASKAQVCLLPHSPTFKNIERYFKKVYMLSLSLTGKKIASLRPFHGFLKCLQQTAWLPPEKGQDMRCTIFLSVPFNIG